MSLVFGINGQRIFENMNSKFRDIFTQKELQEIVKYASTYSEECIVIMNEKYFFELSADMSDDVEIYCDEHENSTGRLISKQEFMEIYRSDKPTEMMHVTIDD